MAAGLTALLVEKPIALAIAVIADLAIGYPVYRLHPVRLMGDALRLTERALQSADGGGMCNRSGLFAAQGVVRRHKAALGFAGPKFRLERSCMAGAIQRRLVGPIWKNGQLVNDIWLGDPQDSAAATRSDIKRAAAVTLLGGLAAFALAEFILLLRP